MRNQLNGFLKGAIASIFRGMEDRENTFRYHTVIAFSRMRKQDKAFKNFAFTWKFFLSAEKE